jgi:hypothetical protein
MALEDKLLVIAKKYPIPLMRQEQVEVLMLG